MSVENPQEKPETTKFWEGPEEIVMELSKYLETGAVLDLGAGKGRDSLYLAEKGFDVTAVEKDPEQLRILTKENAKSEHKIMITKSDIHAFKANKKYDAVVSDMVLHFMAPDEVLLTIEKMKSMTKDGGYNVITSYSDKNPVGKRPYLFRHNELLEYYKDWQIISYEEKLTPPFRFPKGNDPRSWHAVYLLAKKANAI